VAAADTFTTATDSTTTAIAASAPRRGIGIPGGGLELAKACEGKLRLKELLNLAVQRKTHEMDHV
jgi:hypothetical protein